MANPLGQYLNSSAPFEQYLTQAGDGTGAANANGNYSGGATTWYIQPASDETILVSSMLLQIADSGIFAVTDYGSIAGGLLNGISIRSRINNITRNITGGAIINNNWELSSVVDDFRVVLGPSGNNWFMRAQWNFYERFGVPLVLEGFQNDRIEIILNDNFTGLDSHTFTVFGGIIS